MGKLPFEEAKRELIVREESQTSQDYGRNPDKRSAEELIECGVINVDKPAGPTSHQVSAYVKQILGIKKSGHSGTLDPNVVGVLPVALGRATRIVQLLLPAGKEYIGIMYVHKEISEEKLSKVLKEFTGKIKQLPPVKSAVVRKLRERSIYYLEIIEVEGRSVLFKVGCQAGTYIRKLVSDIGKKIGGAHMVELRRTKAGPFREEESFTLHDLTDAYHYYKEGNDKYIRKIILPIEKAVNHVPKIWVKDATVNSLCHGASLKMPGISKVESGIEKGDTVVVMTLKDELVCYGTAMSDSEKMAKEKNGIAAKTDAVFMQPETYPNPQ